MVKKSYDSNRTQSGRGNLKGLGRAVGRAKAHRKDPEKKRYFDEPNHRMMTGQSNNWRNMSV